MYVYLLNFVKTLIDSFEFYVCVIQSRKDVYLYERVHMVLCTWSYKVRRKKYYRFSIY